MIDLDRDQETIINTSQEGISKNQNVSCVITHTDDIYPVINDQGLSDLECNISNTSDNPDVNTSDKIKVTFTVGVNGNMTHSNNISDKIVNTDNDARNSLDHSRSKSTGGNVASVLENRKAEQCNSTSADLKKTNALCCKLSIVFAMFCIIICSLMPIVFYYVSQLGESEIIHLDYSHYRNISSIKVCSTPMNACMHVCI